MLLLSLTNSHIYITDMIKNKQYKLAGKLYDGKFTASEDDLFTLDGEQVSESTKDEIIRRLNLQLNSSKFNLHIN